MCRAVQTLKDVEPRVAESLGRQDMEACTQAATQHLHEEAYSHEEVSWLGMPGGGAPWLVRAVAHACSQQLHSPQRRSMHTGTRTCIILVLPPWLAS